MRRPKNFLVGSVRPMLMKFSMDGLNTPNQDDESSISIYREMYNLSRESARKNLIGGYQEIFWQAPAVNAPWGFMAKYFLIKELWFSEPCNVLWLGADTLFIKPTQIFDKFETFRLFNYTDPRHGFGFDHYFNADVAYFPASMKPELWEHADMMLLDFGSHPETKWDFEQILYNKLLWGQGCKAETIFEPGLAYQFFDRDLARSNAWNRIDINSASLLHFHSTRGVNETLALMTLIHNSVENRL
jgi:hypothetical protein